MTPLHVPDYFPHGSYKWVFHGDDDTVFLKGALKQLLQNYDPDIPYFITDSFFANVDDRPSRVVPACFPCHNPKAQGCPCTPDVACQQNILTIINDPTNSSCLQKQWRWHAYGGAGIIFSRGLLKELAKRRIEFEQCAWNFREDLNFGDMTLSECLWRLGFAPTHPGPYFSGRLPRPMMDPFPEYADFTTPEALMEKIALAESKDGKPSDKEQLAWMVSWHVKERAMLLPMLASNEAISAIRALQHYQSKVHNFWHLDL